MRKILLMMLLISGCTKPFANDETKCFDMFQEAVKDKDYDEIRELTNSLVNDPVSILSKYQNPSLSFLPEDSKGAYGIKFQPRITMYFVELEDNHVPIDTFVIGIMNNNELGYQVTNFSKVGHR